MSRAKKKSVLNQVEEVPVDNTEEVVEEKGIFDEREPDLSQLEAAMENTNVPVDGSEDEQPKQPDEVVEVEKPEEIEEPINVEVEPFTPDIELEDEISEESEEIVVEEKPKKKTVAELSGEDLRFYQRTGIIR